MSEPRIFTIRVPNPFVEGRNCVYVIPSDPVTMIDSGIATDRGFRELLAGLQEHGLAPTDIKRIILTHKHIDHIGNAWRIRQQSGADIMIHDCELKAVTDVDPGGERYVALVRSRLEEWRVPDAAKPSRGAAASPQWEIESADAMPLADGQQLVLGEGQIEVIHTPGHTMGSICLKFGRYLFSGDHVLPDISPNVGGGDLRSQNLLRHYLESLQRIRDDFHNDELHVMPGHGNSLTGPKERCDQLIRHHEQRLDELVEILRRHGEQTVYEIAGRLFGEMKDFHVVLGCAEANAHLEYLVERGQAVAAEGRFRAS